jgi:flagellar hook-associated protein 1
MGNLTTSLINAGNALQVYESALDVTENNVTNANTPGYARQSATLVAQPFDLTTGAPGGVLLGPTQSSRSQFAEQSVRAEQTANGFDQQKVSDLSTVQNYFSLSTTSGIAPDISALFNSFSQLSVTPNDTVARQTVLNDATTVAQDFNDTANGLLSQASGLNQATSSTITAINQLAGTIATINSENRVDPSGGVDAGLDAQMNSTLEQLSQYVNFSTLQQSDGTVSVYVGGQTPLVMGSQTYAIQGDFSTPQTAILSSSGTDITAQITGGQLGAVLDDNNNVIPSYLSGLNTLAQTLADQVNDALNNGIDENGAAPVTNLFSYNASTGAAVTLAVNPPTRFGAGRARKCPAGQRLHLRSSLRQFGRPGGKRSFSGTEQQQHRSSSAEPGADLAPASLGCVARFGGRKPAGVQPFLRRDFQDAGRIELAEPRHCQPSATGQ